MLVPLLPLETVLADRFVLGPSLGAGGMGQVYRARDRQTGAEVAIKVVRSGGGPTASEARFAAEIGVLSELAHPGIVGYVAHGTTDDGQLFLAMQLLEGEDLEARLARGPLTTLDALRLLERTASALDQAHQRGIVHRDLKPSNLFLRERSVDRVTVLDFGIARRAGVSSALTKTGAVLGTPDYMAPEQARGERELGPAADVFALGAVLYHCLAGRPPFAGEHVIATLAKILFEEPPALAALRPDVPAAVVALVARMLDKSPESRLHDAGAVLGALDAVRAELGAEALDRPPELAQGLGGAELELVSVVVASAPRSESVETIEATSIEAARAASDAMRALPDPAERVVALLAARHVAAQRLADGSLVATFSGGAASDQALEASSCAQQVLAAWPEARVAVATARRLLGTALPMGEALERAAALISAAHADTGRVLLDPVTAGLVEGKLPLVTAGPGRAALTEEAPRLDTGRLLLGKPTPCVGREQELAMLELAMTSSFEEGASRAALVLGAPGLGKSRLRHELLLRLAQRGPDTRPVLRLEGRGEALRAASPHAVVAQALRRLFGLDAQPSEPGRARLLEHVRRLLPEGDALGVAELLGELCDEPFPDADSVRLRAARQDPRLMQARLGDAFLALLRGASATHDVLVVLEDLHWADRASLALLTLALRELSEVPLFVVGFARPELAELAPGLWKGHVVELPLRPLSQKACVRLIERVAGKTLGAAQIARIAQQCDGNALYLEELVRAAAEGDSGAHPATLLAMLQARIGHLAPGDRRTLRAASVFGDAFVLDGVRAVLGPAGNEDAIARSLDLLRREEILEPRRDDAGTHRFRHALMRDAAYGLIPDAERPVGHRLAALFLAENGHDPAVVAEHFVRADRPSEAAPWFVRAAQRAQDRDDYAACIELTQRGRAAGATGESLGALAALASFASVMKWEWSAAESAAHEALAHLRPGSAHWLLAQRVMGQLAAYRNDAEGLRGVLARFVETEPEPSARLVYGDAALHLASSAIQVGLTQSGRQLLRRVDDTMGETLHRYASLEAWRNLIHCTLLRHTGDDLGAQLALLPRAIALYEEAGASRTMVVLGQDIFGEVECRAGLFEEGRARLRASHREALTIGAGLLVAHARLSLAVGLLAGDAPLPDEAAALAEEILATPGISAGYQAMARDALAHACLLRGDPQKAAEQARQAMALSPHTPVRRWWMAAHLAAALLALGEAPSARAVSREALDEVAAAGDGGGYGALALLVASARAARAVGERDAADALVAQVDAWCARQAAGLADDAVRARYLEGVAEPARRDAAK